MIKRLLCLVLPHQWMMTEVNDGAKDDAEFPKTNYFGKCARCGTSNIFFRRGRR